MDSTIRFDDDPIHTNLDSVNICFDEELMAERLNDRLVQTNPQYVDVCEMFGFDLDDPDLQEYWNTPEDMSNIQSGLSAMHALKQKGLNKEHIQNIWRISEDETRHNLEVTTQFNMQDADSKLSRALS